MFLSGCSFKPFSVSAASFRVPSHDHFAYYLSDVAIYVIDAACSEQFNVKAKLEKEAKIYWFYKKYLPEFSVTG